MIRLLTRAMAASIALAVLAGEASADAASCVTSTHAMAASKAKKDRGMGGTGLSDERGLCFTYDPASQTLTIQITVERRTSGGRVLTSSAETSVRLRND